MSTDDILGNMQLAALSANDLLTFKNYTTAIVTKIYNLNTYRCWDGGRNDLPVLGWREEWDPDSDEECVDSDRQLRDMSTEMSPMLLIADSSTCWRKN